ncbi:RagB/SusD family nutrient uptake outer membrane protein [Pinibacter aurantiacus]|uniref:RagB/SusD family nutrient uptake outer membrane protein n=1 Tax=Pinibacter aurantiacus TaxID=2851599 RepID=A0A9E2SD93_9BACT|nr:RagB/SusD family nutrient uptake outer membrane protein [Pinibacter aurantiacus]MBV4359009.1 RagB/SusD family nutrient uptake outer membrane protein [Pinibacter aurantiacus]
MKNKFLLYILAGSISLTGCKKDFLVQEPLASFTDEDFWTSESSVRAFAQGYYPDRFPGFGVNDLGGAYSVRETLNDDYTNINLSGFAAQPTVNGGSWDTYFSKIRKDNIFIDRVSKMSFSDSTTYKHWNGIARFFRGFDYANFVFDFGDVPFYNKPLTDNDPALFKPRDPATLVMDSVLADLNYASKNVKLTDPLTGPNGLVITKDVVDAFMSRLLLYVGTKLKYDPAKTADDKTKAAVYLQAAKDAAARVISSGRYSVADNYQKLCSTIDISATAAVSKEMILYRRYNTGEVTHAIESGNNANTIQGFGAPKDVIDAYLCTNGMPIKTTNGVNPQYQGDQTAAAQLANRDLRLANTFRTDRYYLQYIETGYSTTGYKCWKFLDEPTQNDATSVQSFNVTDAPIIRLGEVMLNYIESAAELADMGQYTVVQNDLDITINALRKRTGYAAASRLPDMKIIGGLPAVGTTVYDDADRDQTVPSLIWEIRRERRMELLYEGFRLHDLKRWRKLNYANTELYPKKNLGAWVTKNATTKGLILADINGNITSAANATTGSGYLKVSQTVRNATNGNVLDRNYFDCVPTYQVDFYQRNSSSLTQNPGW